MSKPTSGVSAARRNAEALLNKTKKRESDFKLEQQRENEALALKTARLRELRLAKEAADRSAVASNCRAWVLRARRRSKQT